MKKVKRAVVGLFMAFVMCFGMFVGVAQAAPSSAYASVQDQTVIGVSVPEDTTYDDIFQILSITYPDYSFLKYSYERGSISDQMDDINTIIDGGVDAIIIDPSNIVAFFDIFEDIDDAGIGLFVIGDYVPGCPEGTVFIALDTYYELGINHADWICGNAVIPANASIRIFYHYGGNGLAYLAGMMDGLADDNFPGTILSVAVDTSQDLENALDNWLGQGRDDSFAFNEVVTHSSAVAEEILQRYYLEGYTDAPSGIGIRAFSTPSGGAQVLSVRDDLEQVLDEEYEAYLSDATQTIGNALAEYLNGEEISGAQLINGCYVLSCGFGPGYARYVSR